MFSQNQKNSQDTAARLLLAGLSGERMENLPDVRTPYWGTLTEEGKGYYVEITPWGTLHLPFGVSSSLTITEHSTTFQVTHKNKG